MLLGHFGEKFEKYLLMHLYIINFREKCNSMCDNCLNNLSYITKN